MVVDADGVDQRDVARNQNGIGAASANECDVGAYEYVAAPPTSICGGIASRTRSIVSPTAGSEGSLVGTASISASEPETCVGITRT